MRADFPYTCYQIRLVSEREPILCKHLNKTLIQSNLKTRRFYIYSTKNMEGGCKDYKNPNSEGQKLTSLVAAAESGDTVRIEKLLRAGVDVNAVDCHGYSALIQATENNFKDIVSILLQAGADVNLADS